ncbi:MAG TPA: cytochrome d ubiquinol oxidase subunit II [bacterium]|mgnify:CR=1 FL=1|nr:cytochrome d ubiquinol oxidase subunit II [bacterium]HPN44161.1 cytochrome d ubiquinol oxidase subunit II [bacterium]
MNLALDLNTTWFFLVGILLTGYAILDGFDLGIGALHLFTRTDQDRRIMLNSIGPIWDGNEVWLVTGGGALFAAFPEVYATAFSGFYMAFMLLLFSLIFRAVAIEFRSKKDDVLWRKVWDTSFTVSSIVAALLIGTALGNVARGIPLDGSFEYAGSFWDILNPYSLLIGITVLALFMMHGALYGIVKTEHALQKLLTRIFRSVYFVFAAAYVFITINTFLFTPHLVQPFKASPALFILPLLTVLLIVNIFVQHKKGRDLAAFLSSGAVIFTLMLTLGLGLYPNLLISSGDPANSLTIYNAASSQKTLQIMLTIALIGMPLVLFYTVIIFRIFRGKVKLDKHSY